MDDNKDFKNIGRNIEAGLTEGLEHGNWSMLNSAISDSAEAVINEFGKKISSSFGEIAPNAKNLSSHKEAYSDGEYTRRRQEQLEREKQMRRKREEERQRQLAEQRRQQAELRIQNQKKNELPVPVNQVGRYSSVLYTIAGGVGTGVSLIGIMSALPGVVFGGASLVGIIAGFVFLSGFAFLLNKGISEGNRLKLAKRFAVACGQKGYAEIDNLVNATGMKKKKIIKELRRMLQLGFYPQGRLDDDNTNLILTDKVYQQYLESKKSTYRETVDTTAREVDSNGLSPEEQKEFAQMISDGNDYIKRLRELNSHIPGEVITEKLSRLEAILNEIFTRVKEHPEQMSRMRELMDYYLPTMIKLVSAYEEYDRVSEPGDDLIKAKKDIEDTLDTINVALRKLLNNLFKDSVWDVTSDAQVLKNVLAQNGLVED